MRKANEEQQKSIVHQGGVLLSAGAGSGKTFVLVEHLYYITKNLLKEYTLEEVLLKLETIVVMTFTKKASAELMTRVEKRFSSLNELSSNEIDEVILALNITTIHGFCYQLIKRGYIFDLKSDNEIISDKEFQLKISLLIDMWFQQKLEKKGVRFDFFCANVVEIKEAIQQIFSDPLSRLSWISTSFSSKNLNNNLESIVHDFLQELSLFDLEEFDFELCQKDCDKKWFQYLRSIYQALDASSNLKILKDLLDTCDQYSNIRFPKKYNEFIFLFNNIKSIMKYLKKYREDIMAYLNHFDMYLEWFSMIKSILIFVEKNYLLDNGIIFSDLEYYTYKQVLNSDNKFISKFFNYFIVDEFQDTSSIQFEIINAIVKNDTNKLFCVGDLKQAIYGFRGGELKVFQDLSNIISKNTKLLNNYRSTSDIISFNNSFFKHLFETISSLNNRIEYDQQKDILKNKSRRGVRVINANIVDCEKVSRTQMDEIEANIIYSEIMHLLQKDEEDICVLYKLLSPSRYLIEQLLASNTPFIAQVKIPYSEDIVINIFKLLLEAYLSKHKDVDNGIYNLNYVQTILNEYLFFLYKNRKIQIDTDQIECFIFNAKQIGIYDAFKVFIDYHKLYFSGYKNNLSLLKSICFNYALSVDRIYGEILDILNLNYSFEFQNGINPKIKIMTTHSSKGLEFKHIILAGIHTNGVGRSGDVLIGKLGGSLKWKAQFKKQFFNSLQILQEKLIIQKKDLSESIRLLYVACTRSIDSISIVNLKMETAKGQKNLSFSDKSWINYFRSFFKVNIFKDIHYSDINCSYHNTGSLNIKKPIFHIDMCGFKDSLKNSTQNQSTPLILSAEMSVTRMAEIVLCSRKFFLNNICKLEEKNEFDLDENILKNSEKSVLSSKKRGTYLHKQISEFLISKLDHSLLNQDKYKKNIKELSWIAKEFNFIVKNNLQHKIDFFSEQSIKFDFLGQMISGIPDLFIINENLLEVFDFKTGSIEEDNQNYWFQLSIYAYALYQLNFCNRGLECRLSLVYIDEQKSISETFSYTELLKKIEGYQQLFLDYSKVNLNHCHKCGFSYLCH